MYRVMCCCAFVTAVAGAGAFDARETAQSVPAGLRPHLIGISVRNLDVSVAWYQRMLGFAEADRRQFDDHGLRLAMLDTPDGFRFELVEKRGSVGPATCADICNPALLQGMGKLGFTVADVATLAASLKQKGAEFVLERPGVFIIKDADGNWLAFHQSPNVVRDVGREHQHENFGSSSSGTGGGQLDVPFERKRAAVDDAIGTDRPDERAHDTTANELATFGGHDVYVDTGSGEQPSLGFDQRAGRGDINHAQFASRSQSETCGRVRGLRDMSRRPATLGALGHGRSQALVARSYRSTRVRPVAPSTRTANCVPSRPRT
jgi:catechol 2,3-dioxygenase-like lactoylglutathione lyase family enzyme